MPKPYADLPGSGGRGCAMRKHRRCKPIIDNPPAPLPNTSDSRSKATELYETILNTVEMFNWAMDAHNNVLKSAIELLQGNDSDLLRAAEFLELARQEFLVKIDDFYILKKVGELAKLAGMAEVRHG